MSVEAFTFAGHSVAPGTRETFDLHIGEFADHTPSHMPVHIIHGKKPGPVLFVSAAIHGDEILGVEIIRRLRKAPSLKSLAGTLMLIPVVNTYGFISQSRYLPDRRDLNRSFPGSSRGSLAGRIARSFMTEIVGIANYGIDLHTAAIHRENLPQVRADMDDPEVEAMAKAFNAPMVLHGALREGSLRECAGQEGVKVLLYEASEALRYDELCIRTGLRGVLQVMAHLGMVTGSKVQAAKKPTVISRSSKWVRAPSGGVMRTLRKLGDAVKEGDVLAIVSDPLGLSEEKVLASIDGVVFGRANLPVVNQGDALFHIAEVFNPASMEKNVNRDGHELGEDPFFQTEIV